MVSLACSWPCWKLGWRPWWRSGWAPRATSSSPPRQGRRGFGPHGIPGESCATLKPRVIREDSSTMYRGKYDFLPKIQKFHGGVGKWCILSNIPASNSALILSSNSTFGSAVEFYRLQASLIRTFVDFMTAKDHKCSSKKYQFQFVKEIALVCRL